MDEVREHDAESGRRGSGMIWVLGLVLALPILYVGSIGPVLKLYPSPADSPFLFNVYTPVRLVIRRSTHADRFLRWYIYDVWKVPPSVH
jgi:hypothetical protein